MKKLPENDLFFIRAPTVEVFKKALTLVNNSHMTAVHWDTFKEDTLIYKFPRTDAFICDYKTYMDGWKDKKLFRINELFE